MPFVHVQCSSGFRELLQFLGATPAPWEPFPRRQPCGEMNSTASPGSLGIVPGMEVKVSSKNRLQEASSL